MYTGTFGGATKFAIKSLSNRSAHSNFCRNMTLSLFLSQASPKSEQPRLSIVMVCPPLCGLCLTEFPLQATKKLGWGEFSTVWLAWDMMDEQFAALKISKSAPDYRKASTWEVQIFERINLKLQGPSDLCPDACCLLHGDQPCRCEARHSGTD